MEKKKQRFSLRKNKIGAMSVLLGISFVGAVTSGSDVKANEISEEKAPKLIEKEVVGKTTKQDVEKAQAKVDASKEAESLKNKAIENKKTEITNNDNEISKIKADIERDKDATDENINKAEKKVKSTTEELKNKNSELVKTKAEKEGKESDLEIVRQDVADKTKDLESKQAKAKEIKDEIDGTENVTKKLESEKAKNEDLKKELETEKSNKVVAEKELEKAKEFDAKLADNTKKAEENLKAKQEDLKTKTAELDEAKKDENTKKAEYDAVVMPYGRNVKYKIALDQRFVNKFQEYMDNLNNWRDTGITLKEMIAKRAKLRDELIAIEKEINYELRYDNYSHDDDYDINLSNMSEEERLKMSQYAMHLLNQVRKQFGLEPLKVNKNSMQIAKEISETMIRDNHSSLDAGHYVKGISEVAAKHDLIRGGNYYENLYNAEAATQKDNIMSRNQLYEHVYNSVMSFFYEGIITNSYGHAQSLYNAKDPMGLSVANFENSGDFENVNRLPKELIEKYKQYINFDEFGNITGFKAMPINVFNEFDEAKAKLPKKSIIKISYINVKERVARAGEAINNEVTYDDPSDEAMERAKENYKAKYSNESKDTVELPAVPDLESFKKAYEDAVKVRESKEQPVVDAKANVDSATKVLDELKSTEKQTEKATAKVQEIDVKINNLTTKANEQQKVVDQLELDNVKYIEKMTKLAADLDAAQKDVEESVKVLDQAKALQKETEDEISKLNTKINELESDVKATEEELNKAKTDLEKIRMDRIQLDQNKEKLAKAQEDKAKLEEELKTLTTELDSIKKQLLEDTKEFEKIQRQYKLENFKWAVLADNNTIDPIEFDLEKFLKDNPVKPTEPVVPVKPVEPTTPIKPTEPVAPVKPVEPTTPVKPTEPVVPVKPVEPTTPIKPTEPVVPVKPVEPTTPIKPTEPVAPVKPVEPTTPVKPTEPVVPVKPVEPTTPVKPVEPTTQVSNKGENNKVELLPNTGIDSTNTTVLGLGLITLVGLAVRRKLSN